jgi:hypothetical protein
VVVALVLLLQFQELLQYTAVVVVVAHIKMILLHPDHWVLAAQVAAALVEDTTATLPRLLPLLRELQIQAGVVVVFWAVLAALMVVQAQSFFATPAQLNISLVAQ